MKTFTKLSIAALMALGLFVVTGCEDNDLEDAVEDTADAVEDGAEDTVDAVKDATN